MSDWQTIANEFGADPDCTAVVVRMAEEIASLRKELHWVNHHAAIRRNEALGLREKLESKSQELLVCQAHVDALEQKLAESESECLAQARLNGMGAERELALQARLAIAVEALEFYRLRSNVPIGEIANAFITNGSTHDAISDYTKRASDALHRIGGKCPCSNGDCVDCHAKRDR